MSRRGSSPSSRRLALPPGADRVAVGAIRPGGLLVAERHVLKNAGELLSTWLLVIERQGRSPPRASDRPASA